MNSTRTILAIIGSLCLVSTVLRAQVPQLVNYQGRVAVGGVNFDGTGSFKFALVNGSGSTTFWSNDATSVVGSQPTNAVALTVTKGLYSVLLGDASLANMTAIPISVFNNSDVRLRVWFNNGTNGFQLLTPDQRIAAVGYAMMAANVSDGAITSPKIAAGAVGSAQIAAGAVGNSQLGAGAVTSTNLATGAAAANLNANGQSGVARGGLVLSAAENPALAAAGYVKIGTTHFEVWNLRTNGTAPSARTSHTAVWTGSEMIVWGGFDGSARLGSGARYSPASNSWTPMTGVGAASARDSHTAVWTGSEMIVWGGSSGSAGLNDGARYNPAFDAWTAVAGSGAPAARSNHTAVWTGSEMIVWGGAGSGGQLNDGARYSPLSNSWTATASTGAPVARRLHTAVWTGSEMIVWGGSSGSLRFSSGGRYNPATNSWTATAANSGIRDLHTAVWTGSEMIVWGGSTGFVRLNDGLRYNPVSNTWTTTTTSGAPAARESHTAVWTGGEMIVWGGLGASGRFNDGGRYNPAANSWTATTTTGTPAARNLHSAVWTGSEMIVWGGSGSASPLNDGGRYSPAANSWRATPRADAPARRTDHTAVWTGTEMIVWGGNDDEFLNVLSSGGRFNPATNTWTATASSGAPSARHRHTAVWTGTEMIVWGGDGTGVFPGSALGDGGRYNPITDSWTAVTNTGAPAARTAHTAIWTGNEMIVWGGDGGSLLNNGARYFPATNSWTTLPSAGAPAARSLHTAVWTGGEMIVWGGIGNGSLLNDGARYILSSNTWTATELTGAPFARHSHTAVWTGTEMVVWGGISDPFGSPFRNDGGRYVVGFWRPGGTTTSGAPLGRAHHTAVWTGTEMIIWGGTTGDFPQQKDGARWMPSLGNNDQQMERWTAITLDGAPPARESHTAVWTGSEMIIFGGREFINNDTWSYTPAKAMILYMKP